jgi:hypothetical protein
VYPNVYYVDPRHPAATDEPGWGYPSVPLASLRKACALAKPGETIVLRGGIYRETMRPESDGVTVRAFPGETALISRADLIDGWQRQTDGSWSAAVAAEPKRVFQDGQPFTGFAYDQEAKHVVVKHGDPRLHVFETMVRDRAIDLADRKRVKVEGIGIRE